MSNHYHLVVRLDPTAPRRWSDRDVATRWVTLSPPRSGADLNSIRSARIDSICNDARAVAEYRRRLGSLSWLMRLLNEPIARRANREDECTGHFWEGRFESQALLDDAAWLSATAYVDLNPVRANLTTDPVTAAHTSIRRRLDPLSTALDQRDRLPPVESGLAEPDVCLSLGLADYCALLRWSATTRPSPPRILPISTTGGADLWLRRLANLRRHDVRAFGELKSLDAYAKRLGQKWVRGIGEARRIAALLGGA